MDRQAVSCVVLYEPAVSNALAMGIDLDFSIAVAASWQGASIVPGSSTLDFRAGFTRHVGNCQMAAAPGSFPGGCNLVFMRRSAAYESCFTVSPEQGMVRDSGADDIGSGDRGDALRALS